jgi:2-dehydro-3-deoxy-D-pentonate aldolase
MAIWRPNVDPLRGIIVPMVTPLAGPDELDPGGVERLVDRLLAGGVHGLFLLGTCGEGPSLSGRVRRELVDQVCRQVSGRIPVLVGVTDSSPAESTVLARHAADAGAAAIVLAPPFYFPINQTELADHVERQAAASPLPVVLYNMPGLTNVTFEPETVRRLVDNRKIVGLKDSGGDIAAFRQLFEAGRGRSDWSLLVGPEHLLDEAIELGAHGGVSGGANVWPELFVRIYDAAVAGFADELATLQSNAARFGHIYTVGPFSAASVVKGLKAALAALGVCGPMVCPPLGRSSAGEIREIHEILHSLGLTRAVNPAVAAQQQ